MVICPVVARLISILHPSSGTGTSCTSHGPGTKEKLHVEWMDIQIVLHSLYALA